MNARSHSPCRRSELSATAKPTNRFREKVSRAMNALTAALACGWITPDEMATIAEVCETFVRTAGTAREKVARGSLLEFLTVGDDVEDIGDAEAIDDCDP
jgi:hypothetical protein